LAKGKHRNDAEGEIDTYIAAMPPWSAAICRKLRSIILRSDARLIEDWKWGPNYYYQGMVCGYAAFAKHVNFVFFQGALLRDKNQILLANKGTLHNRHIRFTSIKEIDDDLLTEYILEAIDNNVKGISLKETADKTLKIADDIKDQLRGAGLLAYFEGLAFSHRKEYLLYIEEAKKADTRLRRIANALSKLQSKQMMHDKYKKKKTDQSIK
jgi:uncharacterized protein YdeI (YjbR/CyaY-like superfamily)